MSSANKPGLLVALTIYCVLSSFGLLGVSFAGALASLIPILSTGESIAMAIISVIHLGFGIALLAASYGIWTLQKWGWQLSIVAFSVAIVLGVIAIFPIFPESSFSTANLVFQLIFIAIDALCIRYLMQYEIKKLLNVFPYLK